MSQGTMTVHIVLEIDLELRTGNHTLQGGNWLSNKELIITAADKSNESTS